MSLLNKISKYQSKAENLELPSSRARVIEESFTDVAEKILEIAREENIDAIVVGSRVKYPSSESFLAGSISSKLVHYGEYTVIVVK